MASAVRRRAVVARASIRRERFCKYRGRGAEPPPEEEHLMLAAIIVWIIVGAIAGWLASLVVRGTGLGLAGDIVVGIIGGIIGAFIVSALGGSGGTGLNLCSIVVAFIRAVVVLLLVLL